ncbi:hypothetical protein FA95DRAFT_1504515 [Auriscalpium vulgare]|uniref:Uncharacterized protein n=1 Tax=Auriscalpium vulgare TaxID=40419 RepID=A0ACB8R6M8_9AGAM|nr:hypothetical protein FA95DRAFT_1504515 [Auriscalpium vulgare]
MERIRNTKEDPQDPSWFPWPDKAACILDILRHLPRSLFSDSQVDIIRWGLAMFGIDDVPSVSWMRALNADMQDRYGIKTIRHEGALGHVYYTNSLADIIAQEMANPRVRPHLHHFPEDSGPELGEAWQASRWLHEMDASLLSPMICIGNQDFYTYEPATLSDGTLCVPLRWFTRTRQSHNSRPAPEYFARACRLEAIRAADADGAGGYVVHNYDIFEVPASQFSLSLPTMAAVHAASGLPSPYVIIGACRTQVLTNRHAIDRAAPGEVNARGRGICPWTHTDPAVGNRWRAKARGHRVVTFMMWLYCDDTSGNLSKKWNKHNSFLFTPAGLPRAMAQKEYNVHFLATSNIAPPLEMLDGIADQLNEGQENGIWAWDCETLEMVLVIPMVLAFLGDNPMQSEIACHIGLRGKFFCRCCWVKGKDADDDPGAPSREHESGSRAPSPDAASDGQSVTSSNANSESGAPGPGKKSRRKREETMQELVDRARRFLGPITLRSKDESEAALKSIFENAITVGQMTEVKKQKTAHGLKDTFQEHFIDRVAALSKKFRGSRAEKQIAVNKLVDTFPENTVSPVWRIKTFDPHRDTPVEILHVVLLGFVKYFWRDVIARVKDDKKALLITRLNSVDVSGLGVSPLAGRTLVQYAGSLTGRDFRVVAQAAPFVIYDLVPQECYATWLALCRLVPLIWQPQITDLEPHLAAMQDAIDHFLNCTARWTPRWFNKPKFHIIRHLPDHVRRFGPAILFATEAFESFNAVIRSQSVHSNRHAPSRDLAIGFSNCNRVRHLLSGGYFLPRERQEPPPSGLVARQRRSLVRPPPYSDGVADWKTAGPHPVGLVRGSSSHQRILRHYLGMGPNVGEGEHGMPPACFCIK